jgi:hypothetical protein
LTASNDAAQIAPSCWYMLMKSKLFQASAIFPSLMRAMAMPVNEVSL